MLALNECTRSILTDFSWGDSRFHSKRAFLKSTPEKFDTWFIGSSRVNRQVIPTVLDSIRNASNDTDHVRSFNLASDGLFAPKSYHLYRQLIEKDHFRPKTVFVELAEIDTVFKWALHSREHTFWYGFSNYWKAMKGEWLSHHNGGSKRTSLKNHTTGFLSYLSNAGMLEDMVTYTYREASGRAVDSLFLGPKGDGFRSLDLELYEPEAPFHQDFVNRNREFLVDTTGITGRKYSISRLNVDSLPINDFHLKMALDLIAFSKQKGIRLIFLIMPRAGGFTYASVLPLAARLPTENVMNLADGSVYPQFYETRYSYDLPHLNEAGARLLSLELGNKLLFPKK